MIVLNKGKNQVTIISYSSRHPNLGRFPFDEIFENFGWELNGTGFFPEKIFENLGQPFQCSRKVEISVFSKILVFHSKVSSRTVLTHTINGIKKSEAKTDHVMTEYKPVPFKTEIFENSNRKFLVNGKRP